ncbi:MAG: helix-turn-helix domain-containing protein [Christensenellaceae bacterium]|jgi:transcriptional regulator with XRE-family HTH domain|nr:helix-turn-helix domain-containing protein [Christensenellaceae bacterium]
MEIKRNFGLALQIIMNERGFTQQELSQIIGIRQSQISNWLNGNSFPGYKSLIILHDKLEVSWEKLFS